MTETVAPERVETEAPAAPKPWQGQSIPRKGSRLGGNFGCCA